MYDSNQMTFWKRKHYGDSEKFISLAAGCLWGMDEGMNGVSPGDFFGSNIILYDRFVKTHGMYNTKSDP